MDVQQTEEHSYDELRVIVVDENTVDAKATESALAKLNFQGKYTLNISL